MRPNLALTLLGPLLPISKLLVNARSVQEAPTAAQLCPVDLMPTEWHDRCMAGHLLFSPSLSGDLMPEVGNGHLATVVQSDTIYAAGLYNGNAHGTSGESSHRARIPNFRVWVENDHQKTGPQGGRALDLERAVFLQRMVVPLKSHSVTVEERWYAPLQAPTLLVHEIELWNPNELEETVTIQSTPGAISQDITFQAVPEEVQRAHGKGKGVFALEGSTLVGEIGNKTNFAVVRNELPSTVVVYPKSNSIVYHLTVVVTSLNSTNPAKDALNTVWYYMENGFAKATSLLDEHSAAWHSRSEEGRVEVVGDLALAQVINASLYFIRSSVRNDWPHGLSPGGLASNGYSGHTFWDQESWMWPPFLVLEPELARSLLKYRADRMGTARDNAAECGQDLHSWCPPSFAKRVPPQALMFPWESAHTGVDVQFWGGKLGPWGRYEQHISGDIAFAVRQFWYATRDRLWLESVGFPLVNGIASFYAARINPRPNGVPGFMFDFDQVMGPDEYSWPVNNSGYTNAIARVALEFAAEAAEELGYSGEVYDDFKRKAVGLPVFQTSVVPSRPDLKGGYHPEYEGFPKDPKRIWAKQADTILLSYPLGLHYSEKILANDLDFYEAITDPHGPAMTWSMFAVGWFSVGNYQRSAANFRRGYANSQLPFNVWSEVPEGPGFPGCVNFITGAGGFLQSVIYGVAGMRVKKDGIHFNPSPPAATGTSASMIVLHSFHYLNARLRQEVTQDVVRYELLEAANHALCLHSSNTTQTLLIGRPVEVKREHATTIRRCNPQGATVQFGRRMLDAHIWV